MKRYRCDRNPCCFDMGMIVVWSDAAVTAAMQGEPIPGGNAAREATFCPCSDDPRQPQFNPSFHRPWAYGAEEQAAMVAWAKHLKEDLAAKRVRVMAATDGMDGEQWTADQVDSLFEDDEPQRKDLE